MLHCSSFVALVRKLGSFHRDVKSKLKILSLEVDSDHQTECSMKAIHHGSGLLCFRLMKNVSCEYDRWVVETQLCKLRDTRTSETLIGRGCVCVLHIKPFFLPVDIQHTQCSCRFFLLERCKLCGHKPTTQRYYIVIQ